MAAIEEGLQHGPVHLVKRNNLVAVVLLSEDQYRRLTHGQVATTGEMTAVQWLVAQSTTGQRSKGQIDADLNAERDW